MTVGILGSIYYLPVNANVVVKPAMLRIMKTAKKKIRAAKSDFEVAFVTRNFVPNYHGEDYSAV